MRQRKIAFYDFLSNNQKKMRLYWVRKAIISLFVIHPYENEFNFSLLCVLCNENSTKSQLLLSHKYHVHDSWIIMTNHLHYYSSSSSSLYSFWDGWHETIIILISIDHKFFWLILSMNEICKMECIIWRLVLLWPWEQQQNYFML